MKHIVEYDDVITYHGFCKFTPVVYGAKVVTEYEREREDVRALEAHLSRQTGIAPENHHGWMVRVGARYLYLNFTDFQLYVWEMPDDYEP